MKPIYAKVLDGLREDVFFIKITKRHFFSTEFHFHMECQLTYVIKSFGNKVIGDCIENFEIGELTFLGSELPHVWHNTPPSCYDAPTSADHAQSISLFLNPEKLISLLKNFYDTTKLEQVLQISKRGMKFHGNTKVQLKKLLFKISEQQGAGKLILLLQLLQILCNTNEYVLLASSGYVNTYQTRDNARIDTIFKYLFSNFSNEINLEEVAALANMNKHAFCRLFKARTQKTLIQFINEIRIAHAIKLMSADDISISSIAYECGYNSISNFNKFFKIVTNKTPSDFKRQLHK